jgi:alpha-maltose-1-phosphate synthase
MIILHHPTGNANVRNAIMALHDSGVLYRFITSIALPQWPIQIASACGLQMRLLGRRAFPQVPYRLIATNALSEVRRQLMKRLLRTLGSGMYKDRDRVDGLYRDMDTFTANFITKHRNVTGVYCYEDGALTTFRRARALGITTFYELPTPYWRFKCQVTGEPSNAMSERNDRKDQELALADVVIVPSQFVADSLSLAPKAERSVEVVGYGTATASPPLLPNGQNPARIRGIFVGNVTITKGVDYLMEAFSAVHHLMDLTVIGAKPASLSPSVETWLSRCRYLGSLPHNEVLAEMRRNDVLIHPTLFEGQSLAVLEAMSQGLAIVTTPNAGVNEVVRNGTEGFIVPVRDTEGIIQAVRTMHSDRAGMHRMREAAYQRSLSLDWSSYRKKLVRAVLHGLDMRCK